MVSVFKPSTLKSSHNFKEVLEKLNSPIELELKTVNQVTKYFFLNNIFLK